MFLSCSMLNNDGPTIAVLAGGSRMLRMLECHLIANASACLVSHLTCRLVREISEISMLLSFQKTCHSN